MPRYPWFFKGIYSLDYYMTRRQTSQKRMIFYLYLLLFFITLAFTWLTTPKNRDWFWRIFLPVTRKKSSLMISPCDPAAENNRSGGANGCGKSTLLSTIARLLQPLGGAAVLDGKAIHAQPTKAVARQLGILPQSPLLPEGLTVFELVSRGRFPVAEFLCASGATKMSGRWKRRCA